MIPMVREFVRIFVENQISFCRACLKKVFHSHAKRHVEGSNFTGGGFKGVNIFTTEVFNKPFWRSCMFFLNIFHMGGLKKPPPSKV